MVSTMRGSGRASSMAKPDNRGTSAFRRTRQRRSLASASPVTCHVIHEKPGRASGQTARAFRSPMQHLGKAGPATDFGEPPASLAFTPSLLLETTRVISPSRGTGAAFSQHGACDPAVEAVRGSFEDRREDTT